MISVNRFFDSRSDIIAAIRALQIELGQPVCSSIDDQHIGQQIVELQQYLATQPGAAGGFAFNPALVGTNIGDVAQALVSLQTAYVASTEVLPLHSRLVFEGDSITAASSGPGFAQFASIRAQGRFFCPAGWNQGTGGQTAAQMAGQVAAVTALNPKVVVLLAGTNDLSGTSDSAEVIFANIRTCVEAYKAAGARVVNVCVLPRNDGVWDAGEETRRLALNTLIRAQTDVAIVDVESTFNPTTMCVDGLHPNYKGAIHLGHAVGDKLNTLVVSQSVLTGWDTSANFLVGASENPTFTGTGGTRNGTPQPSGSVPNIWIVEHNDVGGALNVACSIVTLNGRNAVRIQVSGTCDANGRVVNLRNPVTYSGQAGEFWESWWDMSLAAGAQGVRAISCSTDTAMTQNASQTNLYPSDEAVAGVLRAPMTTALAGVDTTVTIQGTLTLAAGAVAADITWAAPFYRKVPDGQ